MKVKVCKKCGSIAFSTHELKLCRNCNSVGSFLEVNKESK